MRERVRHCEARALALREGRRSNPLAMKSIKQDTCALSYGMQQRAMFLLSITLIACTPHRSHTVVRGLLRPSARSQRAVRNDGYSRLWSPRPPAADGMYDPRACASLRGARVGIARGAPKQSPCNEKHKAGHLRVELWNAAAMQGCSPLASLRLCALTVRTLLSGGLLRRSARCIIDGWPSTVIHAQPLVAASPQSTNEQWFIAPAMQKLR
jgi:hypothetical protein